MTDRHAGYVVVLDRDIREDDADAILTALRQVKGVASVEPLIADGLAQGIGEMRADTRWRRAVADLALKGPA